MMKKTIFAVGFIATVCPLLCANISFAQNLSFEERLDARRAIEQAYHAKRIGAGKPFDEVWTRERLAQAVRDDLKKEWALENIFNAPITPAQLDAELGRIASQTQDAAALRVIFASLKNDPRLIKEALVRPILAERFVSVRYERNEEIHRDARERAAAAFGLLTPSNFRRLSVGDYQKIRFKVEDGKPSERGTLKVGKEFFETLLNVYPSERQTSEIKETENSFVIHHTIRKGKDFIEVENVSLPKKSFDIWIGEVAPQGDSIDGWSPSGIATEKPLPPVAEPQASCAESWEIKGPPEARYGHIAVWTGTEMIMWGGTFNNSTSFMNSGYSYDPALDWWTPITRSGAPSPRAYATAVWTGTEMVVWGGWNGAGYLNTGGRYNPGTDTWTATSVTGDTPAGRDKHTAVWTGTEMIVWGGWDGNFALGTGGRYTPGGGWTATSATNAPSTRYNHTAVWTGAEMIVWGGESGGYDLNTGGVFTLAGGGTWDAMSTAGAPSARSGHSAVWTGAVMIIWGGWDRSASVPLKSGATYHPASGWTTMPDTTTDATCKFGVEANPAIPARAYHQASWTGTEMIIWGGVTNTPTKVEGKTTMEDRNMGGERYIPASATWKCASNSTAGPRVSHSAVWTGTEMIVWGGRHRASTFTPYADGSRYDPSAGASGTWTASGNNNMPNMRIGHSAVWTGAEIIMMLGFEIPDDGGGQEAYNGVFYTPATDSWTVTADFEVNYPVYLDCWDCCVDWTSINGTKFCNGQCNPKSENLKIDRTGHGGIWTGTEMLIWGGRSIEDEELNKQCPNEGTTFREIFGGRYTVTPEGWTVITRANQPLLRENHAAVWTGSDMFIWGGNYDFTYFNDGFRYDPSADGWAPLAGAPLSVRSLHTAVWTGSNMIIWGGYDGNTYTYKNDGAAYDGKAWTPLSASSVSARSNHTAVWTGSEMIVWGGYDGSATYLNDGGRYSGGVWTAISSPLTPRFNHGAVWTGLEMLIWGGYEYDAAKQYSYSYTNTGGRYDPASGSWAPTAVDNAPVPRGAFIPIWDGVDKMYIWGGMIGEYPTRTLGVYNLNCAPPAPAPGAVPGGGSGLESENLSVESAGNGLLTLKWGDACSGSDYSVYRGDLKQLRSTGDYNHESLICTTGGATSVTLDPGEGETIYFLIVPHNTSEEGSYGLNSEGNDRSPALSPCYTPVEASCY